MRIKKLGALIVLLVTLCSGTFAKYSPELQVRLSHGGGVSGHFRTSHSGLGILAFTNIPYAEPPTGDLRFSDPVMKAPWTGYLPSNTETIACPQKDMFSRQEFITGTEDCLYLNVYVPHGRRQRKNEPKKSFPVMVYIHGGAFALGSGALLYGDPANILDSEVIVVAINYRLGALGFVSTFEGELTGNWGMKDQQMALQWVQENIESFGGDKDKVTLFGQSAGSMSIGLHMMAPKSKPLFHRAIMQSGSTYDPFLLQDKGKTTANGKKFIGLVGCDGKKDQVQLMKCLRGVSLEDVMATSFEFFEWDIDPLVTFGPVLETNESPNPFIQDVNLNEIQDKPLIIGLATDEGAFKVAILNEDKKLIADLEARFDDILPIILSYSHLRKDVKQEITNKIKQFYLGSSGENEETTFNWARDKFKYQDILSDGWFVAGFDKFVQQRLNQGSSSRTYAYVFNYQGSMSFAGLMVDTEEEINWGVSHGEDILYMFPFSKLIAPHRVMSREDLEFGAEYVQILTDFAITGDPVFSSERLLWNPVTPKHYDYMRIGNCNRDSCPPGEETYSVLLKDPFQGRIQFWRELMEMYPRGEQELKEISSSTGGSEGASGRDEL